MENSSAKINLERLPFSINGFMEEMEDYFGICARKKGLIFQCVTDTETSPLKLEGDFFSLKFIVMSLLSNAIKFTISGSVELVITHQEADKRTVALQILVRDTGIGIPSENMDKIFKGFMQIGIKQRFPGSGFGLLLCDRMVKMNKGEIKVKSEPGMGSEFKVNIPFKILEKELSAHEEIPETKTAARTDSVKALVVDDDEMSAMLLSGLLKKNEVEHEIASDGLDAMKKIDSGHYDIILTDINMPGISGPDLLKKIRSGNDAKKNIPVIALTSVRNKEEELEYINSGFNKILVKPYDENILLRSIQEAISQNNVQKDTSASMNELNINGSLGTNYQLPKSVTGEKSYSFSLDQLKRISDTEEFLAKMLNKFMASSSENSEIMSKALIKGDLDSVMNAAHKSIPSYHMLGLKDTVTDLQNIEKHSRDKSELALVSTLVERVHNKTKDVVGEIKNYLQFEQDKKIMEKIP